MLKDLTHYRIQQNGQDFMFLFITFSERRFSNNMFNVDYFFFAEFQKIAMATAIGFGIMGFIGFFVKLIHIPINNIIV